MMICDDDDKIGENSTEKVYRTALLLDNLDIRFALYSVLHVLSLEWPIRCMRDHIMFNKNSYVLSSKLYM